MTATATPRKLRELGYEVSDDGGGGFEIWDGANRIGRVFSRAALETWTPLDGQIVKQEQLDAGTIVLMSAHEARTAIEDIRTHLSSAGEQLLDLQDREGWKALGYQSWKDCAVAEFGKSAAHVYRLLAAARTERAIGSPIGETPESHLRETAPLKDAADKRAALDRATELAGGTDKRTAQHVKRAVREMVGQREDVHKPDPRDPPPAVQTTMDELDDMTSSARERAERSAQEQADAVLLSQVDEAIDHDHFTYAEQLLQDVSDYSAWARERRRDQITESLRADACRGAQAFLDEQRSKLKTMSKSALITRAQYTDALDVIAQLIALLPDGEGGA